MPVCGALLEPKKSEFKLQKSTFNAKNSIRRLSWSISSHFGAIYFWNVCCVVAIQNREKINKNTYFEGFWSFKVVDLDVNQEDVWDFLLVINSNLSPISHCFWDTATYWLKTANFCTSLSSTALDLGDSFRVLGRALRTLKLESSWQSIVKISWS